MTDVKLGRGSNTPHTIHMLHTISFAQNIPYSDLTDACTRIPELVLKAKDRLSDVPRDFWSGVYLGTSGGKDSIVIDHLIKNSKFASTLPVASVHTPKPDETHPATKEFLYSLPYPVLYIPKANTSDLVLLYKTQIDGTRRSEFNRSNGRSTDVVVGGKNMSRESMPLFLADGLFGLNFIFPIFDWTDAEVWAYIYWTDLPFSPEYLIKVGND